ncbi:MAG: hypothetical protein EHM89_09070 [Acidobacteria bacterium]|jgi:hypothetical protein|nr:MAG: hypothetical protein EHM89_09070 [Acidobacteriota bacterium]
MGDAGEGLIDAQARIAEQMEEREQERKRLAEGRGKGIDPELVRRAESLRLARIELDRQRAATGNAARKQQLTHALEELDRQLAALKP